MVDIYWANTAITFVLLALSYKSMIRQQFLIRFAWVMNMCRQTIRLYDFEDSKSHLHLEDFYQLMVYQVALCFLMLTMHSLNSQENFISKLVSFLSLFILISGLNIGIRGIRFIPKGELHNQLILTAFLWVPIIYTALQKSYSR